MLQTDIKIFTPKDEELSDLLNNIHKHKIALPDFQRPWVWKPELIWDLIVSVAYRYPAGSLLTMPVTNDSFSLRPIQGAGNTLTVKPNLMILDGQQRLTSLYQALYRQDGVQVQNHVYHFYLDVRKLMADPDGDIEVGLPMFEEALFYIEEKHEKRIRYEDLKALYEITTQADELKAGAFPLPHIFDVNGPQADWKDKYLSLLSGEDFQQFKNLGRQWDALVVPWLARIRSYRFPVVELHQDIPLGAVCQIFEKVNNKGVRLDVFDLCNAILWAQGFHLNREWEKAVANLKDTFPVSLTGTYFLQSISLLDSLTHKRDSPGETVAVTCRKESVLELKRETVERWWDILLDGYKKAGLFMTDQGLISDRILPYSTMIVPLAAILAYLKHTGGDVLADAAWSKIEQWYWCSVFSQRYNSRLETFSAEDFEQVIQWAEGGEKPTVARVFDFRSDMLQEITALKNAVYKGVLCLLAREGAKDFGGGGKLSTHLFFETHQDHHHIFPKAALKRLHVSDPCLDTVVNKTLIGSTVNRSISGDLPSKYIADWRHELGVTVFNNILHSHAIDPDILSTDRWDDFVLDRRERLRQLIASACGGKVQPFSIDTATLEIEAEDDEDETKNQ